MLIIPVKEGESIERALKKYKKKFERTGVVRELRDRQKFTKPSVQEREKKLKAIYRDKIRNEML
ncbi:MAG: 30S ribosomal protein S21 [Salibacteraceae bacterium]